MQLGRQVILCRLFHVGPSPHTAPVSSHTPSRASPSRTPKGYFVLVFWDNDGNALTQSQRDALSNFDETPLGSAARMRLLLAPGLRLSLLRAGRRMSHAAATHQRPIAQGAPSPRPLPHIEVVQDAQGHLWTTRPRVSHGPTAHDGTGSCAHSGMMRTSAPRQQSAFAVSQRHAHARTPRRTMHTDEAAAGHVQDAHTERSHGHEHMTYRTAPPRPWVGPDGVTVLASRPFADAVYRQRGFAVMSFNLLADSLLFENLGLYGACPHGARRWKYRRDNLIAEIADARPDVVCLQEVEYFEYFRYELKKQGLRGHFVKRTGDKSDGCALFYRESLFSLVDWEEITYYRPECPPLDRDNVGIVALLRHKHTGRVVCVMQTHLLYNPKRGDIKLLQAAMLLAEGRAVLDRNVAAGHVPAGPCAAVFCGDLNSTPDSDILAYLLSGRLAYVGLERAYMSGQEGVRHGDSPYKPISERKHAEALALAASQVAASPVGGCVTPAGDCVTPVADDATPSDVAPSPSTRNDTPTQPPKRRKQQQAERSILARDFIPAGLGLTHDSTWAPANGASSESAAVGAGEGETPILRHSCRLKSAYAPMDPITGTPAVTSAHTAGAVGTVDYILYGEFVPPVAPGEESHVHAPRLRHTASLRLRTYDELDAMGMLPNWMLSSDHQSLVARFEFVGDG